MPPTKSNGSLGYAEFGGWYDQYRAEVLEPALTVASAALDSSLTDLLSDRDLARIRSTTGRVKSKRRTWRKLRQPRYWNAITTPADIPGVIDDLLGLRVTCINLSDIEMVQAALESLPRQPKKGRQFWLDPASERDYVAEPKPSGYRGWHINLGVKVDANGTRIPVTCELQVRTLLQDGWGELTHEDTYSKDGELPPLVEVLSKRMADLLSTLDDIAEDLRSELDRIDEAAVAETDAADQPQDDALSGQAADAAALLLDRWQNLDRPTDLASLAWALQREFGAEVSDDWFEHGSFKRFVLHAVPEAEISTGGQAYLLPPGYGPDTDVSAERAVEPEQPSDTTPIPVQAQELRRVDRGFPLLESAQWERLYGYLAEAWRRQGPATASTRVVNQLTRSARDQADAAGEAVSRRHLDYVTKAVLFATDSTTPLAADAVADVFATLTVQRMTDLRILASNQRKARAAVQAWLTAR